MIYDDDVVLVDNVVIVRCENDSRNENSFEDNTKNGKKRKGNGSAVIKEIFLPPLCDLRGTKMLRWNE